MQLRVLGVLVTGAMLAGCFATAESHVRAANDAMDRGQLGVASRELTAASDQMSGDPRAIALVKAAAARLQRLQIAKDAPRLRAAENADPVAALVAVQDARRRLYEAGGDRDTDRVLDEILVHRQRQAAQRAEELLAKGDRRAAVELGRRLRQYEALPDDVKARVRAIESAALRHHFELAERAGARWPLARRFHLGLASAYGGGALDDATAMLAPFLRGVEVTVAGVPCDVAAPAIGSRLAAPGTRRRAEVTLSFDRCKEDETRSTSTEIARWTVPVFVRTELRKQPRQVCELVTQEHSLGAASDDCTVNYFTQPPSLQCKPITVTSEVQVCRTEYDDVPFDVYRDEPRSAPREVTTYASKAAYGGTFTIRRDGREWTGTFGGEQTSSDTSYPAVGTWAAKVSGHSSPESLRAGLVEKSITTLDGALREVFALDIREALAAAEAARGRDPLEEDELWIRAVLLGADRAGPPGERHQVSASEIAPMFRPVPALAWSPPIDLRLPAIAAPIEIPPDRSSLTARRMRSRLPPPLTNKLWLQGEVGGMSIAPAATPSGDMLDAGSFLMGVRAGGRLLTRKRPPFGMILTDDASAVFTFGLRADLETGDTDGTLATSLTYQLGAGYRAPKLGGLLVGLRPSVGAVKIAKGTAITTQLPVFARFDVPTGGGSLSLEGYGLSLAGDRVWGGALHVTRWGRLENDLTRFFTVRVERSEVDVSIDGLLEEPDLEVDDVALTVVTAMYGIGF